MVNVVASDTQCGFKAFRAPAGKLLFHLSEAKGFAFDYDVIPGISSVQALAAKHRIPLNRIGEAGIVTPARKLAEALAAKAETVGVTRAGGQSVLPLQAKA